MRSPEEEGEVRWIECETHGHSSDAADDQNTQCASDDGGDGGFLEGFGSLLFADPDPMDTFIYEYKTQDDQTINVTLHGVKAENGQLLNSTGLTVWRASNLLCDYLARHPGIVEEKRVVEVGFLVFLHFSHILYTLNIVEKLLMHNFL